MNLPLHVVGAEIRKPGTLVWKLISTARGTCGAQKRKLFQSNVSWQPGTWKIIPGMDSAAKVTTGRSPSRSTLGEVTREKVLLELSLCSAGFEDEEEVPEGART